MHIQIHTELCSEDDKYDLPKQKMPDLFTDKQENVAYLAWALAHRYANEGV